MSIVDEIEAIVARESAIVVDEPPASRIWNALSELPGMEPRRSEALRCFEYDIDICAHASASEEAVILAGIRPLDIAAAPEVAVLIPFESDSRVLVRRYWACPGERLQQARETTGPFPEAARKRFRSDMEKLVASGKVHPYARGWSHVLVSQETGTLLLNRWIMARTGTLREQKESLETIDLLLATRT